MAQAGDALQSQRSEKEVLAEVKLERDQVFKELDPNSKGVISFEDVYKSLYKNNEDFKGPTMFMFKSVGGRKQEGHFTRDEFLNFLKFTQPEFKGDRQRLIFRAFDLGKRGFVTKDNLRQVFTEEYGLEPKFDFEYIFEEADDDGDDKLNFQEFQKFMKSYEMF
ncbi:hypothetical protein BOX15_Mlig031548g2 [Macrostomum lignano]|uniref:EF-hand domain-containing protein n=1 Tax=Macrostomum lignano TaxID=282301 RepID=A0A267GDC7_9PLAT|nr:hypothetical protein BOX15_Mlig031548g2 [Macrostomum lignano]